MQKFTDLSHKLANKLNLLPDKRAITPNKINFSVNKTQKIYELISKVIDQFFEACHAI